MGLSRSSRDLGQWSVDNPPEPAFFVDTGVHFALERYRDGFLVTDGHHNRVLSVDRHGSIDEFATFGNVVPTGLETACGRVFVTQMGPIPHVPEDGKVVALRRGREPRDIAGRASMLIDVEQGPRGKLYALSQGQWDGVGEGSRALPDTGRLVVVGRHGDLTPVVDGRGQELVLDRPTSVEFVGATAVRLVGHRRRLPSRRPLTGANATSITRRDALKGAAGSATLGALPAGAAGSERPEVGA